MKKKLIILGSVLLFGLSACKKNTEEKIRVLEQLYDGYMRERIMECKYEKALVYVADSRYSKGHVYDEKGNYLGKCDYRYSYVDSFCDSITDCETVYLPEDNKWDEPAVDKYDLGE